MGDHKTIPMAAVMIRSACARAVRAPRAFAASGRSMSTLQERGTSLEDEYFHRREQEMMRKLMRHSADRPVVPEFLVRKTSFKVESLDAAADMDALYADEIVPLLKTEDGFVGIERFVCGKDLDYQVVTKWDSVPSLVAAADGVGMQMAAEKLSGKGITDVKYQNFMGNSDLFGA